MFAFKAPATVDSILSTFKKTIEQLRTVEKEREQQAAAKKQEADGLIAASRIDAHEAKRAARAAEKFEALVSES